MVSKSSSSDVIESNKIRESTTDGDLIRGFLLALRAGGRQEKTLHIYEESIRMLSEYARSLGLNERYRTDCWQPAKVGHFC